MLKFAVLALALAACGKSSSSSSAADDGKVASCNMASLGSCREYLGGNLALGTDSLKKLCGVATTAEFKEVACPTAGVIASCAMPEGKDYYYAAYPSSVEDLEKSCSARGGTFKK